jgi:hypothetical protein
MAWLESSKLLLIKPGLIVSLLCKLTDFNSWAGAITGAINRIVDVVDGDVAIVIHIVRVDRIVDARAAQPPITVSIITG